MSRLIFMLFLTLSIFGCERNYNRSQKNAPPFPSDKEEIKKSSDSSEKAEASGLTSQEIVIPARRKYPLSKKVTPCENFYQYTCGPVVDSFQLPVDRSRWAFSFSDSRERLQRRKMKHMTDLSTAGRVPSARSQQYVSYYQSCLNVKSRGNEEQEKVKRTMDVLQNLSQSENPKTRLLEYMGQNIVGTGPRLVDFFLLSNQKDSNVVDLVFWVRKVLQLQEPSYYLLDSVMKDYRGVVETFFVSIGLNNAKERAENVVAFETRFAKHFPSEGERRRLFVAPDSGITFSEIAIKYPNLRLDFLLAEVPPNTFVRHITPKSYELLNNELNVMSVENLKDYLLYTSLSGVLEEGYSEYFSEYRKFQVKHLGASPARPSITDQCTRATMRSFGPEIDEVLYPQVFPNFPEGSFRKLVEKVRKTMHGKLEQNLWLNPKTIPLALEKLDSIKLQVVIPKEEKNWGFMPERKYSLKYLENQDIYRVAMIGAELKKLGRPTDKEVWYWGPLTVNAGYDPPQATFVMPVGILQYPFYDSTADDITNLGAVGFVVGHEVGHAFDDQGSKYDRFGNLNTWMLKEDLKKFDVFKGKIDQQFLKACREAVDNLDTFTVPDNSSVESKEELYKICSDSSDPKDSINNFASRTRGENIGDITGLQFAYATAFPGGKGALEDKKRFFLQAGKLWCSKLRRGSYLQIMKTNVHAVPPLRTNEVVVHLDGFYEAFSCQAGDRMYLPPKDRVNIW